MKMVERIILTVAGLALIAIAALSGVWMKPDKKDKDSKVPNITVIVPPAGTSDPLSAPATIPAAKRYPL